MNKDGSLAHTRVDRKGGKDIDYRYFRHLAAPKTAPTIARVLYRLCCGESFNQLEAAEQLHNYKLDTTISYLANKYRIKTLWVWGSAPSFHGQTTKYKRYRIAPDSRNLARCYLLLRHKWGFAEPPPRS